MGVLVGPIGLCIGLFGKLGALVNFLGDILMDTSTAVDTFQTEHKYKYFLLTYYSFAVVTGLHTYGV